MGVVDGMQVTALGADAQVAPSGERDRPGHPRLDAVLDRAGLVEESRLDVSAASATRGARQGRYPSPAQLRVEVEAAPDAGHLLLVDDDGVLRWELPVRGATRAGGVDLFTVDLSGAPSPAQRGVVAAVGKRVLRVFAFRFADPVLGAVGDFFVRRWEERNRAYRLRTFGEDDYRRADVESLSPGAVRDLLRGGPGLLLIHGTSSLSHTGFGLLPPEAVRGFGERYGGRVVAFDHPTLGSDPSENATWLAQRLPHGAGLEVDVLCHSRGGLVARVLAERGTDVGLDPATLRVRSVTFVATPNGGTPLCDRAHLVDFVDTYTNLLDLVPDNPLTDVLNGLVEVLKQLAVGAYGGLDGAMAMDPSGPFLTWLNQPVPHDTWYRAVAADYEPAAAAPLARSLRDRLLDRVFGGEPNDLIVPTTGAYGWNGGSAFPIRERVLLQGAHSVDHSSYWVADEALSAFGRWLGVASSGPPPQVPSQPAVDLARGDRLSSVDERLNHGDVDGLREAVRRLDGRAQESLAEVVGPATLERFLAGGAADKVGVVVLLHGVMGSNLFAIDGSDADHIWISPSRLANGEFRRLRLGAETIEARGLHRSYLPLLMTLDQHWRVVPFAYDWRLSAATAAEALAKFLVPLREHPLHILAHSMGGLVARHLIASFPELWAEVDDRGHERGGRLVMLGTPNQGTFLAPLILTGKDRLLQALARADVRNSPRQIQEIFAGFPGLYDLLPADPSGAGSGRGVLFDPANWGDAPVGADLLEAAANRQEKLAPAEDPERMVCVLGAGHETPWQIRVDAPGQFRYRMTRAGDGRVSHDRGRLGVVPVLYAEADHAGLVRDGAVLAAVDDLLLTGTARTLPSAPLATGRHRAADGARWQGPEEFGQLRQGAPSRAAVATPSTADLKRDLAAVVSEYLPTPTSERRSVQALALRVLHASLEHASHAVLVGHYSGDPIAGAEGFLDRRLGGRLTNRQIAGVYAEELGEVVVVPGTKDGRPRAAIVVGLGPRGDLTPTALSAAVSKAVLTYAVSVGEQLDDETITASAPVSTLLVGSHSGDGLPVETSVVAIVEGAINALRTLAEHPVGSSVRIPELEFVEIYAHRASRAVRAVHYVERALSTQLSDSVELRPAELLDEGEGRRAGDLPADYDNGSWRRLVVTAQSSAGHADARASDEDDPFVVLNFTSMGRQARADQLTQHLDRHLLTRMIADGMAAQPHEQGLNSALYELLLPTDLKHDIATVDNLHLVVDDRTADFPWELLADRVAPGRLEAIARRTGMLRQLSLTERRRFPPRARENSALVIGNPPAGRGYPDLPGAAQEAAEVADLLQKAYRVDALIFDESADGASTPGEVAVALLDGDYRVLHIAGHGHYEEQAGPQDVPLGGVVIGEKGAYLTASTIGQLRQPPDLVFLNCCHLGRVGALGIGEEEARERTFTRRNLNRLAASLSRELMAMGVRAVVAAGWPVSDYGACEFARTMYERMLEGIPFGDAVKFARRRAFDVDSRSNTWAAYQCYGDPAFRLAAPRASRRDARRPVARHEWIRALDDITIEAGDQDSDTDELLEGVRELERELPEPWRRADVLVALGTAYGELGNFHEAIRCLEESLRADVAELPLRGVEQLANFKVRLALQIHRAAPPEGSRPDDVSAGKEVSRLFEEAERWLELLRTGIGETPERLGLLGSLHKRRAAAGDRRFLGTAIRYYAKAATPYTMLNALQLQALTEPDEGDEELEASVTACRSWVEAYVPSATTASYWERVAIPDLMLTRALLDDTLPSLIPDLRQAYLTAFKERSTPRQRASTLDHLLDLAALAPPDVGEALKRMHGQLQEWASVRV